MKPARADTNNRNSPTRNTRPARSPQKPRSNRRTGQADPDAPDTLSELLGESITALTPTARDPSRISIKIGRRLVCTLDELSAHRAGVKIGATLTEPMLATLRTAAAHDEARRLALRRLERAMCSHRALIDNLRKKGVDPAIATRTADDLARLGLLNDEAFANNAARAILARKPAGRMFIESKLRSKRIAPDLARAAAETASKSRNPLEDALNLAERKARTLSIKLDKPTRQRRLYATLARRGFEPEIARKAVSRVLKSEARNIEDE